MTSTQTPTANGADYDAFRRERTLGQRVQHILHSRPALSPLIVLVLACILFSVVTPRFDQPLNLSLIAQQAAVVGALSVGQTIIILTAGIDLSIGAVMVLASFVMAKLVADNHVPVLAALLAGLVIALVAQTVNGLLVSRVKLPPFIVTLGTLSVFTALTLIYAKGQTIVVDPNSFLLWTGRTFAVGPVKLTFGVVLMLAVYGVAAYMLHMTKWGRHLYATGDDAEGARLAGIGTKRVLLGAYLAAGIVCAVTAWILVGRVGGGDPNSGLNLNLQSITAVVIGGTSLFGGRGVVVGTLLGAFIVQVIENGLALAGVDPNYQVLAVGVLVIVAVSVDQWIRKVKR